MIKKYFTAIALVLLLLFSSACSGGSIEPLSAGNFVLTEKGYPETYYSVYFDAIGGKDVMPVGGFHGPHTPSASMNGQSLPDYVSDEYFQLFQEVGVNLIVSAPEDFSVSTESVTEALELCEKYGMGYFISDTIISNVKSGQALDQSEFERLLKIYYKYPGFVGLHIADEPVATQFAPIAELYDGFYKTDLKSVHAYTNLLPIYNFGINYSGTAEMMTYEEYIRGFVDTVHPKFLSYDHYPYTGLEKENYAKYFENLSLIRQVAEENCIPFWTIVQAGGQWNDAMNEFESEPYYPTEGQMLWDVNMGLAFGAKGIQYFPLIQPRHFAIATGGTYDFQRNGLLGTMGNRTQWFYYAKKANEQIRAIDSVLMNSYNAGIIAIGSEARGDIGASSALIESGSYRQLTRVEGDCVVGCFDYMGGTALYVVNYSRTQKNNISLHFNDRYGYDVIQRAQLAEVAGDRLTLTLEAGEGALVVLR